MENSFEKNTRNGVVYFSSSKLSEEKVRHFFSTRIGGVSKDCFSSLNLGIYSNDEPDNVVENFINVGEAANINMDNLIYLNQIHSDIIHIVDDKNFEDIGGSDGDAIITRCKGITIGVFTADCVPILLHDEDKGIIAAVHAGWKGTEADIVMKTVKYMAENMDSKPECIKAAIGPSIGICCFEVGESVAERFTEKQMIEGKWYVDLATENYKQLCQGGLLKENIDISGLCTKCDSKLFYSYRREDGNTGRMGAFIQLI